jgi:membrane-associated protease RseP (regulator of RpoE activity)
VTPDAVTSEVVTSDDVAAGAAAPPAAPLTRSEVVMRLAGLAVGTASVTTLIALLGGWPWIVVIYSVIAIIMLHELGHYVTARLSHMKATEFFVGFGPKLWSVKRGETEYGVKALPLGGYVRILGMSSMEELDPNDEPRSFINQSTSKRVVVASAGSIVHVLLAFVLAFAALFFIGRPQADVLQIAGLAHVKGVVTPAQHAGLRPGDILESVDGVAVTVNVLSSGVVVTNADKLISTSPVPLAIRIKRDGRQLTLHGTPKVFIAKDPNKVLGIDLNTFSPLSHPGFTNAVSTSTWFVGVVFQDTFSAFGKAFSLSGLTSLFHEVTNAKAGKKASSANQPHSIIGALTLGADAAKAGMLPFLEVLISLNISLGILNMLPMLPLDGGHVAIAVYERIRTRRGKPRYRADVSKLVPYAYAFMALLLVFVASKVYLDIAHGVSNPFG